MKKARLKKAVKYLNTVKAIFFITFVINVLLFAYKHESKVEHANYKILVQESEGSSNYVEYEGSSFPKSGYTLASYECENNGTVTQTSRGTFSFTGNSDSCTLKFDISGSVLSGETLELLQALNSNITVNDSTPDFSQAATTDEGLFETDDDYGTSYYWRGAVTTNYVKFGTNSSNQDLYWRIVRINGDGSLRLIYAGTSATAQETLGTSVYNNDGTDNAFVGYMYGTAGSSTYNATHSNTNSSAIKTYLENWYLNNFSGKDFEKYISDEIFCNDRTNSNGYNQQDSEYGAGTIVRNVSLVCFNTNDKFTKSDTQYGNAKLSSSIGMVTYDETVFSGANRNTGPAMSNSSNFLYKPNVYWTMTPRAFYNTDTNINGSTTHLGPMATMYTSMYESMAIPGGVSMSRSVVPVINISQEAVQLFIGNGTSSNPFRINMALATFNKMKALNNNMEINNSSIDVSVSSTDEGIYAMDDNYGTSYYWRGKNVDNYVKFGNWYWRAIRINGDGTLRLVYDGSSPDAWEGINTALKYRSTNIGDNTYVGYMTGTAGASTYNNTHSNSNNSAIKTEVDSWYESNIKNQSIENYISDTYFCNDRSVYSGTGIGRTETVYSAKNRLETNKAPSFICTQKNDTFTVNNTNIGNGKLKYPIALITEDEVVAAGGYGANQNNNYLFRQSRFGSSQTIWTMTPWETRSAGAYIYIWFTGVQAQGLTVTNYVVPVINITPEAVNTLTGSGTSTDPFVVH